MARHHLVAADSFQDRMHHRPLRCRKLPALFGLRIRKLHHFSHASIEVQLAVGNEDAAPNDVSGLADAFNGPASEAEVHWWLPFAPRSRVAADEVLGRDGAGNLEKPDEVIDAIARERPAPP